MASRVAFLGLGVMGYPMAGHLARAGHEVTVYNRSADKASKWVAQHGGRAARTPAEAAKGQEFVMMCVGNDDDVRAVAAGPDGALAGMAGGGVLVDHTTASAEVARETHAAAKAKGVAFLDAPVSGGQAGAENGKLTIMVGGDAEAYARVEGVLATYARAVTHMGPAGNGQLTKMVNQICIAGLVQSLAEGIHFGKRAGLDIRPTPQILRRTFNTLLIEGKVDRLVVRSIVGHVDEQMTETYHHAREPVRMRAVDELETRLKR